jgi:hypothetical protein
MPKFTKGRMYEKIRGLLKSLLSVTGASYLFVVILESTHGGSKCIFFGRIISFKK